MNATFHYISPDPISTDRSDMHQLVDLGHFEDGPVIWCKQPSSSGDDDNGTLVITVSVLVGWSLWLINYIFKRY